MSWRRGKGLGIFSCQPQVLLAHSNKYKTQEYTPHVGTHEGAHAAEDSVSKPEIGETDKKSLKDRRTTDKGRVRLHKFPMKKHRFPTNQEPCQLQKR